MLKRHVILRTKAVQALITIVITAFFGTGIIGAFTSPESGGLSIEGIGAIDRLLFPLGVLAFGVLVAQYLPFWDKDDHSKFDATAAKFHETSRPAQFTIIRGGVEGTRKASLGEVCEFLDACELTPESAEWKSALAGVPIDIDGALIQFIRCS